MNTINISELLLMFKSLRLGTWSLQLAYCNYLSYTLMSLIIT